MVHRSIFIAIALCLGASAQAATSWSVLDLSTLYKGGTVIASAINDSGQVAGYYQTDPNNFFSRHAFISGPNGGAITNVGGSSATLGSASGINNAGQVVGRLLLGSTEPGFITGPNGVGTTQLDPLDSGRYVDPQAVNSAGQVTGHGPATISPVGLGIFITGPNGVGTTYLGAGAGYGINDSGQVTGDLMTGQSTANHAFVTDANGANLRDLGTLGGVSSSGRAINESGQVVGYAANADGVLRAFLTGANGLGMQDLGTLGGSGSAAWAINEAGQVAGQANLAGDGIAHAFITGANGVGMIDLNSLVTLAGGVYLQNAWDVNNRGQVLAQGSNYQYYLLTPTAVPEPGSWALMALGMGVMGAAVRRTKRAVV